MGPSGPWQRKYNITTKKATQSLLHYSGVRLGLITHVDGAWKSAGHFPEDQPAWDAIQGEEEPRRATALLKSYATLPMTSS